MEANLNSLQELLTLRDRLVRERSAVEAEISRLRFAGQSRTPELGVQINASNRQLQDVNARIKLAKLLAKEADLALRKQKDLEKFKNIKAAKEFLLPCPFCGGEAILNAHMGYARKDRANQEYWYGMCCDMRCGCALRSVPNQKKASQQWNRRVIRLRAVQKAEWLIKPT